MEEKYMIHDVLKNSEAEINNYTTAIIHSEDLLLRQTLQNIRNEQESFQYDLSKLANSKGYYFPALQATPENISKVKKKIINN